MRIFKALALAGALALSLSGCAGIGAVFGPSAPQATTVAVAEQLYTETAKAETVWLRSGLATKAQAEIIKSLDAAAYADIVAGRTAVANNDSAAVAVALKLFNQAMPEVINFITGHGGKVELTS